MLRFDVYPDCAPAGQINLAGAYAFGQDAIPIRADLTASEGQINCIKRTPGAVGLAVLWDVGATGQFLLPTTRLPERGTPYNLTLELARSRIMQILQKREDWGLFDYADAKDLNREFDEVRKVFVAALQDTSPQQAAKLASQALADGITLGEKMALFHADIFLKRRKNTTVGLKRGAFGAMVDVALTHDVYKERLRDAVDYYSIPMSWKALEPKENSYQYAPVDAWINTAIRARKAIHSGPLLSFNNNHLPEWLFIWEHDYETIRDLIYEHIQRVVSRYGKQVQIWKVVSGIHANNVFNLNFEQLMELTRMSCLLVKKLAPQAQVMIELVMPWGEYYARNQRTIPPFMYADMAVQSGVKFDAFGVQIMMGVPADGYYVRDLMQVSSMLDQFVPLGKPVHVTACQVPSENTPNPHDASQGQADPAKGGRWHTAWSQRLQAEWLQAFTRIAISKPFVESVCWTNVSDCANHCLPNGGLCQVNLQPKLAYRELRNFRAWMHTDTAKNGHTASEAASEK